MYDYDNYIKKYWVGLMDGDGSIQVNHWKKKNLQFRLVIKLKYDKNNLNMLLLIKNTIGGNVNITKNNSFIIWVMNNKKEIIECIKLFDNFPLLTSKKQAQLQFLKQNLIKNDINWYLENRNNKYDNLSLYKSIVQNIIENYKLNNNYSYFYVWLSGFIEAEGCFSLRKANNHSFSIGQNDDLYLIEYIKNYFNASNKILLKKNKFYLLEIYKKSILINIINHCKINPLLGEKYNSYIKFYNQIN